MRPTTGIKSQSHYLLIRNNVFVHTLYKWAELSGRGILKLTKNVGLQNLIRTVLLDFEFIKVLSEDYAAHQNRYDGQCYFHKIRLLLN